MRYTRFPVRGGRQIPEPTGNSSLFVVFGGWGWVESRGKERRRTSRPPNLHIWLRVATAPIGIAKSQIGLVRGPDPLRRYPTHTPSFDGDGFRGKVFPFRYAFPPRFTAFSYFRLAVSRHFNTGIMRAEACLTGCNNKSNRCCAYLFEYVRVREPCASKKKIFLLPFDFTFRPLCFYKIG